MAVGQTRLAAVRDTTNQQSIAVTLSRAVASGQPCIAFVFAHASSVDAATITGGGLTWVQRSFNTRSGRRFYFTADGVASPSGTTLTVDSGDAATTGFDVFVYELTGTDGNPAGWPIATGDNTGIAAISATLPATPAVDSMVMAFAEKLTATTTSWTAGFTEDTDSTHSAPTCTTSVAYQNGGSPPQTVTATFASSASGLSIAAVEILAAGGGSLQTLTTTGIASAEAVGASSLNSGAVNVAPAGIAGAEALGAASIARGAVSLVGAGAVATAEALGAATLTRGAVFVSAAGAIATAEALGAPSVIPKQSVLPTGVGTSETLGAPTLVLGIARLTPSGVASSETVGAASLTSLARILANGVTSQEALGASRLAAFLGPSGVATAQALGTATVSRGPVFLAPAGIATAAAFGTARFKLFLLPSSIGGAAAFGIPAFEAVLWQFFLNGVERTDYVRPLSAFKVEMGAGQQIGVMDAELYVPDGVFVPQAEDVVQVKFATQELYEGVVRERSVAPVPGTNDVRYHLSAQDLTSLLDDDYINTGVRSVAETAKARIEWLLTTFGTKGIAGGATVIAPQTIPVGDDGIPRQDFNGMTLRDAVEAVISVVSAGLEYYVDRDYKLHVFQDVEAAMTAPFSFSETPNGTTLEPIRGFELIEDTVGLAHKVLVVGGPNAEIRRERTLVDIGGTLPTDQAKVRHAVVRETSITSDMQADALGDQFLREHGHVKRSGKLYTYRTGLRGGMNTVLDHPAAGLNALPIRINQVTIDLISDTLVKYTVEWGDRPPIYNNWRDAHFSNEIPPIVLEPGSVDGNIIAPDSITATHITNGAITTPKIAALAVQANQIDAGAITAIKIAADAVTADKLDAGAVTADAIAANAVTAGKIDADAITAREISLGAVGSGELGTGAVTGTKITDDAITTPKIATGAVTADEIAANAVTATKIAADSIDATKIQAGAITADEIAVGAVGSSELGTDAVTGTKIADGVITTAKVAAGAITANEIGANAITAAKIAADAIDASKIAAGAITASEIAVGAVGSSQLGTNAVTGTKIADGVITTAKVAADAIDASKIQAGAITATELAANSVTAAKIASGAITTDKLLAGQVAIRNGAGQTILDPNAEAMQIWGAWNLSMTFINAAGTSTVRVNLTGWSETYPPFIIGMVNVGSGKSVLMPYTQFNATSGVFNTFFYAYATSTFIEVVRVTRIAVPAVSFRVLALIQGAVNG